MKQFSLLIIAFGIILFGACSQKSAPVKSVSDTPKTMELPVVPPVVKLTYQGAILSLLQQKCSPCHFPSKGGFKASFENYENALKYSAEMVSRIQLNPSDRGFMPFRNAKLDAGDIDIIKKWVSDGALDK